MAGNGNVDASRVWSLADVFVGDTSNTIPTLTDNLLTDPDWDLVGFIDEDDAITNSVSSTDNDLFAYGAILLRTTSVKEKPTLAFTALENTSIVWGIANPGSDQETGGGVTTRTRRPRNLALAIKSVVLDLADGDVNSRLYIPKAQILATGDRPISDADISGWPLTITELAATDEDGTYFHVELTDDESAEVSGS